MTEREPPRSTPVVLSLGSNLGNRETNLSLARFLLAAGHAVRILKASSLYETQPVECPPQPWFLNQLLLVGTELPPAMLLARCMDVERRLGRHRSVPKGPRTLDVDLVLYGSVVIRTPVLTLPHEALPRRRSLLVPLVELGLPWRHPALGLSPREMLERCTDPGRTVLLLPELED